MATRRNADEKIDANAEVMDTPYDRWAASQGIDVFKGYFVENLFAIPLKWWERFGGYGIIINLEGTGHMDDAFVFSIPSGTPDLNTICLKNSPMFWTVGGDHCVAARRNRVPSRRTCRSIKGDGKSNMKMKIPISGVFSPRNARAAAQPCACQTCPEALGVSISIGIVLDPQKTKVRLVDAGARSGIKRK